MEQHSAVGPAEIGRRLTSARHYPESLVVVGEASLWMERINGDKRLAILAPTGAPILDRFTGQREAVDAGHALMLCPLDPAHAATLRSTLPWLEPVPLGLTTSAGFGDRLGLATPGHARALRAVLETDGSSPIAPIFAQQSIREMNRTGRDPAGVLADATWGAFQAAWRAPVGADADHVKTIEDIDATAAAGYTFYTIDPGAYVNIEADHASPAVLRRRLDALPWHTLESDPEDTRRRLGGRATQLENRSILLEEVALIRSAVKYGTAVAHVSRLYRHLEGKGIPFELEVSVDETDAPTSHADHIYIARELQRLGVRWVSLAPRFTGRFEKGIDYIGSLNTLRADIAVHAAIARGCGPYKLSLHSGSDKFSVYPLFAEATRGMVHLKTAGTSYLEALRVTAQVDPPLFGAILARARECYPRDRATYHVSADLNRVPLPASVAADRLPALLDDVDARQVLHVTFGSILAEFRLELLALLRSHEERYGDTIERHFIPHLAPFARDGE